MEVIAEIRRRHLVSGESISSIARDLKLSRPTVRKHLQTESEAVYLRSHQPAPKLGEFQSVLESWLATERQLPKAQRRTAQRLFEGLQAEGLPRCLRQRATLREAVEVGTNAADD
jgi:predicted transcriptional regulator